MLRLFFYILIAVGYSSLLGSVRPLALRLSELGRNWRFDLILILGMMISEKHQDRRALKL